MTQYNPINLDYFYTAPIQEDESLLIDCPIEKIWPIFAKSEVWETICKRITKATWTSEPPLQTGSTRRVQMDILGWKSVVNEVFFDWEPDNYQFAFYMKDGSCDKIDAYGELWSLKDMGNDTTTVRVRAAFQMMARY